jgi:hypothetical protein
MLTIELSPRPSAVTNGSTAGVIKSLGRLLDRCEVENIRDLTLRMPADLPVGFDEALRPVLNRPFRFHAWFRGVPPVSLANLFYATGNRVTIGIVMSPRERDGLSQALKSPVYAAGAPWQTGLFLAFPVPLAGFCQGLEIEPRAGTNLTLGLAWNELESGPALIPPVAESEWTRFLLETAGWWTERGVTTHLECGVPLCIFPTEQLGKLALLKVRQPLAVCAPSLVVTLDGHARACPLLPAGGWVAMPAGVSLREFETQIISSSKLFASFCNRPNEQSCRSLATGACGGGCIAHNAQAWRGSVA